MYISSIDLSDFRNYHALSLSFDPGNNIIFGDNAQGKTNLLEACFVSATTRSHRGSKDSELISFGAEEAHIRTKVEKQGRETSIDFHLKQGKKKGIAVNHVPLKRSADLFGILNIILFSPEDLNIIKEGPSERRRFMDMELCQLDRVYLSDLTNYRKALNQRNALLKDLYYDKSLEGTLDAWDIQLVNYGKKLIGRRAKFIEDLSPIVSELHTEISGRKENPAVAYEPAVSEKAFEEALFMARDRDIRLGSTSVGPHRDDISFAIEGRDIRTYGSEGQKRTCALSLKLSEIRLVESLIDDKPVLLLDDVLSELDRSRQNLLLSSLSDVQTIITCTGLDDFVENRFHTDRLIHVVGGTAEVIERE